MKIKIDNQKYLHLHINSNYEKPDVIFLEFLVDDKVTVNQLYFAPDSTCMAYFENIIIPESTKYIEIITEIPMRDINVQVTAERKYNQKQLDFNKKIKVEKVVVENQDLYVASHGNTANPKKMILIFPGFSGPQKAIKHLVQSWSTLQKELEASDLLEDVLILAFQDTYRESGSYMLVDDEGNSLRESVVEFIKMAQQRHEISNENLLFTGASKGASIAIYYSRLFERSVLIGSVPQLEIHKYYQSRMDNIGNLYLVIKDHLKKDFIDLLIDLVKNKKNKCLLYLSTHDDNPLFILEELERGSGGQFELRWSDLPHGQVTKQNNNALIKAIINWVGNDNG